MMPHCDMLVLEAASKVAHSRKMQLRKEMEKQLSLETVPLWVEMANRMAELQRSYHQR